MLIFNPKLKQSDPCPCGSGKKFRKCCNKNPKRLIQVEMEIDPPQKIDLVRIYKKDGTIKLFSDGKAIIPKSASLSVSYKGTSKFVCVNDLIIPAASMTIDPHKSYLTFDELYAVDTNTKTILNTKYAISVAVKADITLSNDCYRVKTTQLIAKGFTSNMNHEKTGWCLLITHLMKTNVISKEKLIGIVVDHDRDNISKYNRKEVPIIAEYCLPKGVRLIYAKSKPKGSIYNALITNCDKRSNKLFKVNAADIRKCIGGTSFDTKYN